jgi:hypothetical protein
MNLPLEIDCEELRRMAETDPEQVAAIREMLAEMNQQCPEFETVRR